MLLCLYRNLGPHFATFRLQTFLWSLFCRRNRRVQHRLRLQFQFCSSSDIHRILRRRHSRLFSGFPCFPF